MQLEMLRRTNWRVSPREVVHAPREVKHAPALSIALSHAYLPKGVAAMRARAGPVVSARGRGVGGERTGQGEHEDGEGVQGQAEVVPCGGARPGHTSATWSSRRFTPGGGGGGGPCGGCATMLARPQRGPATVTAPRLVLVLASQHIPPPPFPGVPGASSGVIRKDFLLPPGTIEFCPSTRGPRLHPCPSSVAGQGNICCLSSAAWSCTVLLLESVHQEWRKGGREVLRVLLTRDPAHEHSNWKHENGNLHSLPPVPLSGTRNDQHVAQCGNVASSPAVVPEQKNDQLCWMQPEG